jgi:hypothetical protein
MRTTTTLKRLQWGSPRKVTADGVVYVPDSEEESDAEDLLVSEERDETAGGKPSLYL